jgi:hypothetical protein
MIRGLYSTDATVSGAQSSPTEALALLIHYCSPRSEDLDLTAAGIRYSGWRSDAFLSAMLCLLYFKLLLPFYQMQPLFTQYTSAFPVKVQTSKLALLKFSCRKLENLIFLSTAFLVVDPHVSLCAIEYNNNNQAF